MRLDQYSTAATVRFLPMDHDALVELKWVYVLLFFHSLLLGLIVNSYQEGVWKIRVELPDAYPYKCPSIGFVNKIYHPNIDEITGSVCLDVINQTWSPMFDLVNVFEVFLPQLLIDPNASDPLSGDAAALMMRDHAAYEQKVKEDFHSRKHELESSFGMVTWTRHIAKHPLDPAAKLLPEPSKWKERDVLSVRKHAELNRGSSSQTADTTKPNLDLLVMDLGEKLSSIDLWSSWSAQRTLSALIFSRQNKEPVPSLGNIW
ncbi:unnamed protein product [Vicia faba]|uniref:UBC core domain-containing protein n=1 Tax=Vicia faba TaxID=3906 RepID=A0AAV1BA48_VICFA|nr:unnamed protein product [Vicia faba]